MKKLSEIMRRDRGESLDHVRQLIRLVQMSGGNSGEWEMLNRLARMWGVDEAKVEKIRKRPESVREVIPKDGVTRSRQLYDLIGLMLCDGNIAKNEVYFIHTRAHQIGFKESDVDQLIEMVRTVVEERRSGFAGSGVNENQA